MSLRCATLHSTQPTRMSCGSPVNLSTIKAWLIGKILEIPDEYVEPTQPKLISYNPSAVSIKFIQRILGPNILKIEVFLWWSCFRFWFDQIPLDYLVSNPYCINNIPKYLNKKTRVFQRIQVYKNQDKWGRRPSIKNHDRKVEGKWLLMLHI